MTDKQEPCPLYLRFTGNEKWASFHYFDADKYPEPLKDAAESCGDRYSLLLYYSAILQPQLDQDVQNFLGVLNEEAVNLRFKHRGWTDCTASYHSIVHMASLHGLLFNLKSFLDRLAFLWGKLVATNCNVKMFTRRKVGHDELSGGVLINWLRESAPAASVVAKRLAHLLEQHSRNWITEAVAHRDRLIHYGGIPNLRGLSTDVPEQCTAFDAKALNYPGMPDGILVTDYCAKLVTNTETLVRDGASLFPELNPEKAS